MLLSSNQSPSLSLTSDPPPPPPQAQCEPQAYRPMHHQDFKEDLRKFRQKSRTWNGERSKREMYCRLKKLWPHPVLLNAHTACLNFLHRPHPCAAKQEVRRLACQSLNVHELSTFFKCKKAEWREERTQLITLLSFETHSIYGCVLAIDQVWTLSSSLICFFFFCLVFLNGFYSFHVPAALSLKT